ncbi:hypothetical protein ES708_16918 [subsurface metagenome]
MNELTAAFALGQLKKLDRILGLLKEKKKKFKQQVAAAEIPGMGFRKINDPEECATLFTVLFEDKGVAARVAKALRTKTVSESGWHVYNHMEQILAVSDEHGKKRYWKHLLPRTDDILARAINLSIGVVDPGLGAGFGISILAGDEEIERKAELFIKTVKKIIR